MSQLHKRYVKDVSRHLTKWLRRNSRRLADDVRHAAIILLHLDVEPAREILQPLYAPCSRGRKPYDPVVMFRALILMALLKYPSLPKFAKALQCRPRLAKLAGFEDSVPVAGTFYAFISRLIDGPYHKPCDHRIKRSTLKKGMHRRNLKTEKEQRHENRQQAVDEYDSVTAKLKEALLADFEQPRPTDLLYRLEEILVRCAVIPSAELGLLGDVEKLTVCGDGSSLVSAANGNGKATCDCRAKGNRLCNCDRLYSDPTADWGYDSYRDTYYFGHTFYQHVVSTEGHDLPIHVAIGKASESDFTLSLKSIDRLRKMVATHQPTWKIEHAVYDAGHDATGIYEYLNACGIQPVIAINRRGESVNPSGTASEVDSSGRPICKAGLVMRRHSHSRKRHRTYYNCPVKRPTHHLGQHVWQSHVEQCPLGVLCQPHTKMGPVVYVKTDNNPRLYPTIERHTAKYKALMNLRSGCERSNSLKKNTYQLGNRVARGDDHFLIRLYVVSIVEHATVWAKQDIESVGTSAQRFDKMVTRLLSEH